MIAHLLAFPMITFADMKSMFLDSLGAPLMHASRTYYPAKGYIIFKPQVTLALFDRQFVYADSVRDFLAVSERLESSSFSHCVVLGEALPVLAEYGIKPHYSSGFSQPLILEYAVKAPSYTGLPPRVQQSAQAMLDAGANDLLLPKIHPLFYRIADKSRREQAKNAAFAYLVGLAKMYMHTGVPALDRLLESDLARRTRALVQQVLKSSLDEVLAADTEADEFELRYLIAKHTELSKESK